MSEELAKRVRAAAAAGWWTVIIFAVYVTIGWLIVLAVLHAQPEWMLAMWGAGGLRWAEIQKIYLWFFGVMKMLLLAALMATVFLTIWGRRLGKAG